MEPVITPPTTAPFFPALIAATLFSLSSTALLSLSAIMVLQTANYSRRPVECENTPPINKINGFTKSLTSRIRNSIQDASRRRRARATGGAHSPRYTVEQAKRRSTTKSPSSIRFHVAALPRTPPRVADKDVEMKDASPSPTSQQLPTTPITLPRYLTRPEYREIPMDVITAIDPELKDTTLDYVLDGLQNLGPRMLQVLSGVQADPVRNVLPKELSILVNDISLDMPTHMFAVYARQTSNATRRRVTLFPVHNIVLASHCANLPKLPSSPKVECPETPGSRVTVPVIPLCIPSPQTFPSLSAYLYTKRTDNLLLSLLPCAPPTSLSPEETDPTTLLQFATKLGRTYTAQALLQHAMTVNGLWRNVCALGIFDNDLWSTMDLAWEIVITALAIGTGNLEAVLGSQLPVTP